MPYQIKPYTLLPLTVIFICCTKKIAVERTAYFPRQYELMMPQMNKENVWVFLMAGQSNMAGRGMVEPQDTLSNERILCINKEGQLIGAKEPLHFYEPALTGLDCGLSFAKTLIKKIPPGISVLLVPTAVGGSSISQWLGDSVHRNVKLLSNFKEKVKLALEYGTIKAILWHQGESDTNEKDLPEYEKRLALLLSEFRAVAENENLPVLLGELGSFSNNKQNRVALNHAINQYAASDINTAVVYTGDLKHKGDYLHFNSEGQRKMGSRFAEVYLKKFFRR